MTVVACWTLIYWPHLPEGFVYSDVLRPADRVGLLNAVHVSLVTLSTLGLGDIAPTEGWLRVVAPMEGLIGFALLSATVSWILGIHPALARRRALALRLSHLYAPIRQSGPIRRRGRRCSLNWPPESRSCPSTSFSTRSPITSTTETAAPPSPATSDGPCAPRIRPQTPGSRRSFRRNGPAHGARGSGGHPGPALPAHTRSAPAGAGRLHARSRPAGGER
ncbi:potassium channel family protein [Streptomyces sp. NPDC059567]|uniref:potassium channel family protein n=1 Tax=Streptomyces sp. NPDC059567 TaxID=3346867 RepID=UPI0036939E73